MPHLNRASAQSRVCSPRAAARALRSDLRGPARPVPGLAFDTERKCVVVQIGVRDNQTPSRQGHTTTTTVGSNTTPSPEYPHWFVTNRIANPSVDVAGFSVVPKIAGKAVIHCPLVLRFLERLDAGCGGHTIDGPLVIRSRHLRTPSHYARHQPSACSGAAFWRVLLDPQTAWACSPRHLHLR